MRGAGCVRGGSPRRSGDGLLRGVVVGHEGQLLAMAVWVQPPQLQLAMDHLY